MSNIDATQTEIAQLRAKVAQLEKQLSERQQLIEQPKSLSALRGNFELVTDLTRYAEGLEGYSEADIRRRWKFTEEIWTALGTDDNFVRAVEIERLRRIKDGSFKRERSQQLITKGPDVLSGIMLGKESAKHKIDAVKALDFLTGDTPRAEAEQDRVVVTINLGGDEKLRFEGSVRPDPNSSKIVDVTPDPLPGFAITEG
jgi:hypothetical protein